MNVALVNTGPKNSVEYMAVSAKGNNVASFSTIDMARKFQSSRDANGVKISIVKITTIREYVV